MGLSFFDVMDIVGIIKIIHIMNVINIIHIGLRLLMTMANLVFFSDSQVGLPRRSRLLLWHAVLCQHRGLHVRRPHRGHSALNSNSGPQIPNPKTLAQAKAQTVNI